MAKNTNSNGILKLIIALAGALIAIGILTATIRSNEQRIDKVEVVAKQNENDIREIKTHLEYIRKGVDDIKRDIQK